MVVKIVYGTDNGATKSVASRIAKRMDGTAINITDATASDFERCDLLILGVPTYGEGELQADWEDNLEKLKTANISGKRVALFGLGDQETYPDSFVDALGILYDEVLEQGADVVGFTETADFTFSKSRAQRNGKFVGLALDEDTQSGKTGSRINSWISQLA